MYWSGSLDAYSSTSNSRWDYVENLFSLLYAFGHWGLYIMSRYLVLIKKFGLLLGGLEDFKDENPFSHHA